MSIELPESSKEITMKKENDIVFALVVQAQ